VRSKSFQTFLNAWHERLQERYDVFLGYSSRSSGVAAVIRHYLENDLRVRVLDWQEFPPAGSILDAIEKAEAQCTAGVFLFTADDRLDGSASADVAAPRDNVVFEAGYFARGKGKERVLIIRQRSAKMPADLGGDIYVPFSDDADFPAVKERVARFIASRL
jgi:predicted nucleotide-binding protein